jgi:hypothetical protein
MANFTATLDLHPETHHTKNVADNQYSPAVTAAAAGLVCCSKHPGIWISRPRTKMLILKKTEVRDCPACVTEISSSSDLSSSNKTALHSSVQATPVNSQLMTTKPSVESNFKKHIYPDGAVYEGSWEEGKRNGKGKYTFSNGDTYDGDWKDDKINGKGKYTWPNGGVYEGDFKDTKKNGKGKYTWSDRGVYEGDYKDDKMNGKGKYTYPDGGVYEGDFKDDNKNGKGKYTWPDGRVYDGDWKDDKMCDKRLF